VHTVLPMAMCPPTEAIDPTLGLHPKTDSSSLPMCEHLADSRKIYPSQCKGGVMNLEKIEGPRVGRDGYPHAPTVRPNRCRRHRQWNQRSFDVNKYAEERPKHNEESVLESRPEAVSRDKSVQDQQTATPEKPHSAKFKPDSAINDSAFFKKHTYSTECAQLAQNFHVLVTNLHILDQLHFEHDTRFISVMLTFIFYKYQVDPHDMALDLAVTLVYLEDVRENPEVLKALGNKTDAFNFVCFLAYLAHTFNADRTIRLSDWYKEIGQRSFRNCSDLNAYVFLLFSRVRGFTLRAPTARVKSCVQKLCTLPVQN